MPDFRLNKLSATEAESSTKDDSNRSVGDKIGDLFRSIALRKPSAFPTNDFAQFYRQQRAKSLAVPSAGIYKGHPFKKIGSGTQADVYKVDKFPTARVVKFYHGMNFRFGKREFDAYQQAVSLGGQKILRKYTLIARS